MDMAYIFGGSYPHIAKAVIGATVRKGVPLIEAATGSDGVVECSATAAANQIGVAQENVTLVTAQTTDGSDAERTVSVIVNPDAVWKAKISGAAAESTAMRLFTVDNVSADGLSVLTDVDPNSPDMLNGTVWGLSGANKGLKRRVTTTGANDATVIVPFHDIAVGDTFLFAPNFPFGSNIAWQLTTNLTQVRDDIAGTTGIPIFCVGGEFKGRSDSFGYIMLRDHALSGQVA